MTENQLPITKEQFNDSTLNFIKRYQRLPYQPEDEVEVLTTNEENEEEIKVYRANRYIKEYYKTQIKMSQELLKNNIVTYKMISELTGISETILKNAINKENKTIDVSVRKAIDIFFNHDYYKELGEYSKKCEECQGCKCMKPYFMSVIYCPDFKKKTKKK